MLETVFTFSVFSKLRGTTNGLSNGFSPATCSVVVRVDVLGFAAFSRYQKGYSIFVRVETGTGTSEKYVLELITGCVTLDN